MIANREQGFTLVEILIVLGLLGVMLAVVVPNLTGFLGRGQIEAWRQDRNVLQLAADGYYTDIASRAARRYPTLDGTSSDTPTATVYINMTHLISEGYLRDVPRSSHASSGNPGGSDGTYVWFVDSRGVISSTATNGTRGYADTFP